MLSLEIKKTVYEYLSKLLILSTLMCIKKFDVAFVDPEIIVPQCLHLALKLPSGLSGML